jgi:hypothetical protein
MANDQKTQFTSDVIIVDAAYLNFVARDMRGYYSNRLGRAVEPLDLQNFLPCAVLDALQDEAPQDRMVIFVYDKKSCSMSDCNPSDIAAELDGKAFRTKWGEFQLLGVCSENFVSAEELFADLLTIVADSDSAKRIVTIAPDESLGEKIEKIASDAQGKEIVRMVMMQPEEGRSARQVVLAYPMLMGIGIRGDEL